MKVDMINIKAVVIASRIASGIDGIASRSGRKFNQ